MAQSNFLKRHLPEWFAFLPATEVHPHDRLLARSVLWILPLWVTPNQITWWRVVLTPLVAWLTVDGQYVTGILFFLFAAFTDALDGSLARTRDQITRFGMLFDPLADKLLIGTMVLIIVVRNLGAWLGWLILLIEVIFMLSALVVRVRFKTVHMANRWGKIKMILQVVATGFTLLGLVVGMPYLFTIATWLFGLSIGFAIVSLFQHGV